MDRPGENSKNQTLNFGRLTRFFGALLMLFLFWLLICVSARIFPGEEGNAGVTIALAVFAIYLIIQGGLLMWLTGLLFKQHRMQASKFSLSGMLIIMTMIALPFGFSSIFEGIADPSAYGNDPNEPQAAPERVILTLCFSVIPLITVCEAVTNWLMKIRR